MSEPSVTTPPQTGSDVSVVVRRRIFPELQQEFEVWLEGITDAARAFEGHQGAQVLRPQDPAAQDYVILFRYERPEQLEAWRASKESADWLARGLRFTQGDVQVETITGMEFWFRAPPGATERPARHKMVVATVIGLYPLILFLVPIFSAHLSFLPKPMNVLVTTLCMVLLMTYAVMPVVTKVLSRWLYGSSAP